MKLRCKVKKKKIHNYKTRILGPCEDQIWMALITATINIQLWWKIQFAAQFNL